MVFQFTTTTGPQQVSSSSRTTTVRTTQTTSGASRPLLGTGLTTGLIPTGSSHTTTQYVTSGVPMVTQTRYATTAPIITTGPVVTTTTTGGTAFNTAGFMKPSIMTYPTQTLGTLSMTPFRPMYTSTLTTTGAPMGLATGPVTTAMQTSASSQITYSNSASLTINGVRCEGYIAVANDRIVEGKNLFVGIAPFVLSQETLEVTPEMTVVARNPDIKYHLGDLPNAEHESLTLSELRKLAEIDESSQLWIGLPGQAASLVTDNHGGIQFLQHSTPTLAPTLMPAFHH